MLLILLLWLIGRVATITGVVHGSALAAGWVSRVPTLGRISARRSRIALLVVWGRRGRAVVLRILLLRIVGSLVRAKGLILWYKLPNSLNRATTTYPWLIIWRLPRLTVLALGRRIVALLVSIRATILAVPLLRRAVLVVVGVGVGHDSCDGVTVVRKDERRDGLYRGLRIRSEERTGEGSGQTLTR